MVLLKQDKHHKHTSTCRRRRGGNTTVCTFNIPFPPMCQTVIMEPLEENKYIVDDIKNLRLLNSHILVYLNNNSKTLSKSEMTMQDLLDVVEAPSYKKYF